MTTAYFKNANCTEESLDSWESWKGSEDEFRMYTSGEIDITYRFVPMIEFIEDEEEHRFYSDGMEV